MRVRVFRVSAYSDPETGRPGKIIELVEVRRTQPSSAFSSGSEDVLMAQRLLQSLVAQLQGMGLMPPHRDIIIPKVTLILTEEEYDMLGVKLEVNEEFDLEFSEGKIIFKPL
ncbi:MAG: arcadin 1 [Nitrososphaerota archaeon]